MGKAIFFAFDVMLTVFLLVIMFIFGIFAVHYNQFNTYKSETEAIVSRYGGFNSRVQGICNERSERYYMAGGIDNKRPMFWTHTINNGSVDDNENHLGDSPNNFNGRGINNNGLEYNNTNKHYKSVQYGDEIHYRIQVHIPMLHYGTLKVPAIQHTFQDGLGGIPVSVISQVRQDSQNNGNIHYKI